MKEAGDWLRYQQLTYDALGRADCQAQRMNPAAFGSLPASACSLGTQGSFGPDRITKTIYDAVGQVTQQRVAVGTADEAAEVSATYTNNGNVQTLTDGENNKTSYDYDGHGRLAGTFYPVATKGAGRATRTTMSNSVTMRVRTSLAGGCAMGR